MIKTEGCVESFINIGLKNILLLLKVFNWIFGLTYLKNFRLKEIMQIGMGNRGRISIMIALLLLAIGVGGCLKEKSEIGTYKDDRYNQGIGTTHAMRPVIWNNIEISTNSDGKAIIVIGDNPSEEEIEAAKKLHLLLVNKIKYDVIPVKKWSELTDTEKTDFNLIVIGTPSTNPAINKIFGLESIKDSIIENKESGNKKYLLIGGGSGQLALKSASKATGIDITFNQAKINAKTSNLIKKLETNYNLSSVEILDIIDETPPIIEIGIKLSNTNESIDGHIFISSTNGNVIEGDGYHKSWIRYLDWDKNPKFESIVEKAKENVADKIQQRFGNAKISATLIEQQNSWTIEFYSSNGEPPIVNIIQK